jgi:hypothetical protein
MNVLSALTFANPALLWFLLALPAIWWLLRATPPAPVRVRFAPFRLLEGLRPRREEARRTPWWLLMLRMALLAALIIAMAGPRLDFARAGGIERGDGGAVLVVVDDGWTSAARWPQVQETLARLLKEAAAAGRPVMLLPTAPALSPPPLEPASAESLTAAVVAMRPAPFLPDRRAALERISRLPVRPSVVLWLSDGLDHGHAREFSEALAGLAARNGAHMWMPEAGDLPVAVLPPVIRGGEVTVAARRAGAASPGRVRAVLRARNGRALATAEIVFRGGALTAYAKIRLPLAVRNQAAMIGLSGQPHAGAVWLLDDAARQRSVLVLSGETRGRDQPLLSPSYYVVKALEPVAEVSEAPSIAAMDERLDAGLSMLVLADVGRLDATRRKKLLRWIRAGGVLVRFAGPRLAAGGDDLVPVRLRLGGRQLGAVLSWDKPQGLAPFPEKSPLAGLVPDRDIVVRRQVLAEPDPTLPEHTWARLTDGTPLITARREGKGLLVLVHVTASPEWSNLPMTGLFVDMLRRILELAPPASPAGVRDATGVAGAAGMARNGDEGVYTPVRMLDGTGALRPPPAEAMPVPAARMHGLRPSPRHPPGIYAMGARTRALNVTHRELRLRPLRDVAAGLQIRSYARMPARDLAPVFFGAAAGLFLADGLAMLWLAGVAGLAGAWRRGKEKDRRGAQPASSTSGAALIVVIAGGMLAGLMAGGAVSSALAAPAGEPPRPAQARAKEMPAQAEDKEDEAEALAFAMKATSRTRFAYVLTGNEQVDEISRAGLFGLSEFLAERTSVEPGEPMAVDIERDEIAFFPLIYWPVLPEARRLSPRAVARLDTYLKNGGTILFDTRDAPEAELAPDGMTPARRALRRLLADLDIPPLEPVPRRHVLTRSFYLIQRFPGRHDSGRLWVEVTSAGREREKLSVGNADGVSSVLITGNDMAGAWAISPSGQPLLPVTGGARQREFAIRAGINIVMYALTGNYKADQVHLPAILQRLGQ